MYPCENSVFKCDKLSLGKNFKHILKLPCSWSVTSDVLATGVRLEFEAPAKPGAALKGVECLVDVVNISLASRNLKKVTFRFFL